MKHRNYDFSKDNPHGATVKLTVRLSRAEATVLDGMKHEGGFPSRNALVRSILQCVFEDEQA